MRRSPYVSLAIVAGTILLLSVIVFRRYLPYAGGALAPKQPPTVVLEMRNAHFVGLSGGRKIWSVKAKSVQIGQNRYITDLKGITDGTIFDKGKAALSMQAGHVRYNSGAGDLLLDEGIRMRGPNGERIAAEGAYWNSSASTLRSSGRVIFQNEWTKASADSVLMDMKAKELAMWNVHASVDIAKQGARDGF